MAYQGMTGDFYLKSGTRIHNSDYWFLKTLLFVCYFDTRIIFSLMSLANHSYVNFHLFIGAIHNVSGWTSVVNAYNDAQLWLRHFYYMKGTSHFLLFQPGLKISWICELFPLTCWFFYLKTVWLSCFNSFMQIYGSIHPSTCWLFD